MDYLEAMVPPPVVPNQVNVHDAKTNFSKLIARVQAGEEIVIAKAGRPVAKLVKIDQPNWRNAIGALKGKYPPIDDDAVWFERDIENEQLWGTSVDE